MNAPLLPQPQRGLHQIPPPQEPYTHCGIDIMCELPSKSKGSRHILVVVYYISKYMAARAVKKNVITYQLIYDRWRDT